METFICCILETAGAAVLEPQRKGRVYTIDSAEEPRLQKVKIGKRDVRLVKFDST
jgi:hypothetical protein